MLDLDLDLEADLGVDTVKQAELFAAVRETYGIERDDQLKLRDYPTLNHVIGFVRQRAPQTATAPTPVATPTEEVPAAEGLADSAAFPRRVPVPVVRPGLDLCEATGIELGAGTRVVVMPDGGGVADALAGMLAERGVTVLSPEGTPDREAWEAQLRGWMNDGPIAGVYWLPALDLCPLDGLDATAWHDALHRRVKLLVTAMRVLYDDTVAGHFLVSAVRLGGNFGYDPAGATDTIGGATSGFTKALARERADALVKVVDHAPDDDPATVAARLLAETERDPATVEVGYADGLRWSVGLAVVPAEPDAERALSADDVFVVTGAAGSIVSAITADLAAASHATFHLLDLTGEPADDDADLERFMHDRDGLKTDLAARIAERGERATPALVERELARLERSRAALDAIRSVRGAGGTVHWYQVDLTDADAVHTAIRTVLERSGRVDALVHCAGLEISRFLPDKTDREYDLVFDVKVDGWFHLLHAIGDAPLGAAVVFSSIAGRFGNGGQTDYSAANDLLCKSVSAFRRTRPGTVGVAVDWTAWAGIGMASRGSIPKMMAMAGIDMLPAEYGVPVVRRELTAAGAGREIVVAGSLGIMLEEHGIALDATGDGAMGGSPVASTVADGITVATALSVAEPFLDHHRIDGTPVLPGVMGIEAFAEASRALAPGYEVVAVEDVEFLAPFKLYRDEPRTAEVRARLRRGEHGELLADCVLVGRRTLPNQPEQVTTHFTGRVVLAPEGAARPPLDRPPHSGGEPSETAVETEAIYRIYFHGPAYQVLARAWAEDGLVIGMLAETLPADRVHREASLLAMPRLVELCFQTAGVHQLGTTGQMALPARIARLEFSAIDAPDGAAGGVRAVVTPVGEGADAVVVDGNGDVLLRLTGYSTTVLPGGPADDLLAPLHRAMA